MSVLNTELIRNGQPVPLRWGHWHLDMLAEAGQVPSPSGITDQWGQPLYILPGASGEHTFDHDFAVCDPTDREEFHVYAGDTLRVWTSWS